MGRGVRAEKRPFVEVVVHRFRSTDVIDGRADGIEVLLGRDDRREIVDDGELRRQVARIVELMEELTETVGEMVERMVLLSVEMLTDARENVRVDVGPRVRGILLAVEREARRVDDALLDGIVVDVERVGLLLRARGVRTDGRDERAEG